LALVDNRILINLAGIDRGCGLHEWSLRILNWLLALIDIGNRLLNSSISRLLLASY